MVIIYIEEVPVKRMDRPSAKDTKRGRASETHQRKSAKNMEMPQKTYNIGSISVAFPFFW